MSDPIRNALPTPCHVAFAIVAACQETGDDPVAVVSGSVNGPGKRISVRARHYVLHALLHVFPDTPKRWAAKAAGAPGDPIAFYNNSYHSVAKVVSPTGRRFANWWDEAGFERVVSAIRAVKVPAEEIVEVSEDEPAPRPPAPPPVKLCAKVGSIVEPSRPSVVPGKRRLEDELRAAVQNTQRMTPPPEEHA